MTVEMIVEVVVGGRGSESGRDIAEVIGSGSDKQSAGRAFGIHTPSASDAFPFCLRFSLYRIPFCRY